MRREKVQDVWWREVAPNGGNPTGFDEYYTYDGLHRLEKAERGTLAGSPYSSITSHTKRQNFGLEALGNWREFKDDAGDGSSWDLDQDRTHNAVNETTGITGGSWIVPGYDAAGNMLSGPKPDNPTVRQHYKWDAWNRLVAVYADDNNEPGDLIEEYRYDALNRRIAKIKPDTAHQGKYVRTDSYYTTSWQVIEERTNGNLDSKDTVATTLRYQYVWDIRYIDAPVCRDEDKSDGEGGDPDGDCTDPADGKQGENDGDEHLYYCNDANMNVTALVDVFDGAAVERYMYDPYGKPTILHGVRDSTGSATTEWTTRSSNTFQNAILYCGYFFDDESGLYCVRHRPYNFALGRWLSRDPTGYADGMSLYEYVKSMPCDATDAFGEITPAQFGPGSIGRIGYSSAPAPSAKGKPQSKSGGGAGSRNSRDWTKAHFLHTAGTYRHSGVMVGHTAIGCERRTGEVDVFDYIGGEKYRGPKTLDWWIDDQSKQCPKGCKFTFEDLLLSLSHEEVNMFCNRLDARNDLSWDKSWIGRGGEYGHNCTSAVCEDMAATTSIKVEEVEVPGIGSALEGIFTDANYYNRWGKYTMEWLRAKKKVVSEKTEERDCIGGGGGAGN